MPNSKEATIEGETITDDFGEFAQNLRKNYIVMKKKRK